MVMAHLHELGDRLFQLGLELLGDALGISREVHLQSQRGIRRPGDCAACRFAIPLSTHLLHNP